MLIDEASNLNLNDGSIDIKFDVDTCRPLIPYINWRNLKDDWYTSKGSIIDEKQHEVLLQDLVLDQNSEIQNLLENHNGLQDTFKRTMNGSSQQKFRKLYSTPKPVAKIKLNKLSTAQTTTSIHARRERDVKLKSTRYQVVVHILIKRNFDSHIQRQCIQDDYTRYRDFHKTKILRDKIAKPLHSVTIEHPSKSGNLNGVGKIFLDLFDLNKYNPINTISFMIDNIKAS